MLPQNPKQFSSSLGFQRIETRSGLVSREKDEGEGFESDTCSLDQAHRPKRIASTAWSKCLCAGVVTDSEGRGRL